MTAPYAPPPYQYDESQYGILFAIRRWAWAIASLVATVPVGFAINPLLIDLMPGRSGMERTAYAWAASSILASMICSIATAWLSASRIAWYHFFVAYQVGWLIYSQIGVGGADYGTIPNSIYFGTPFILPAIVAFVVASFNSRKTPKVPC
jgi:hypothetical protein